MTDLSLYVSSRNYASATRPAYASILTWPNQWITPSNRRAAAQARTQHLGLSAWNLDAPDDVSVKPHDPSGADRIPESLPRRPPASRKSVTSLLSEPQHQHRFRLQALTRRFLQPLQDRLGKKSFLLSDDAPVSVDCWAVAYLSLALYPALPEPWLADLMRSEFGRLCAYVHHLRDMFFGGPVRVEDALDGRDGDAATDDRVEAERNARARGKGTLPWKAPERGGLMAIGSLLVTNVVDSIPLVDQFRATNRLARAADDGDLNETEKTQLRAVATARRKELVAQIVTVGAGLSGFVGYLFYAGILSLSSEEEVEEDEKQNLADMGEAGAMLAMADYVQNGQMGNG